MMKIALNAASLAPGRMGGVETYFRNLLRSLQQVDDGNDYLVVCNERYRASLGLSNPRFSQVSSPFTKPAPLWYLRVALKDTLGFDLLRPVLNRLQADVIHHPFSILNPADPRTRSVLTFVDLQHELFPEYFAPRVLRARQRLYRQSAQQATRIIAISADVKDSLVQRYQIAPEKIDVVHIGYGPQFRVLEDPRLLAAVRQRHGLQAPFIYYPAATWPHKNHKRLLAALKLMKERYGFSGRLVLSGIAMQANDQVLAEIGRLGLREDVVLLGYLPQEDLPPLYNLARLMAFPSLFEGFGIPLVEAMACGCPVACAGVTSIPEVVGAAGVLFDPLSVEEMAQTIWTLWSDEELRRRSIAAGLRRAQEFSWEKMARQTVAVYRKAVQG